MTTTAELNNLQDGLAGIEAKVGITLTDIIYKIRKRTAQAVAGLATIPEAVILLVILSYRIGIGIGQ